MMTLSACLVTAECAELQPANRKMQEAKKVRNCQADLLRGKSIWALAEESRVSRFRRRSPRAACLGAADEPAGDEHQDSPHHNLKGGLQERRVHIAMADVADDAELDGHHKDGYAHGDLEL